MVKRCGQSPQIALLLSSHFPKKRRLRAVQTAGNAQGRQRSAKEAKGAKVSKGRLGGQCSPLPLMPPFASQCPPCAYPCKCTALRLLQSYQARPPKTKEALIKGIPSPYYGVHYRAPIKSAHFVRFGADRYSLAGASATAMLVYSCNKMFTAVPFA